RAPAAGPGPGLQGPGYEDHELARRRHREPAVRSAPDQFPPGREAAGDRPEPARSRRCTPAPARTGTAGIRPLAPRADSTRRDRDDVPRCPPVAARDARAYP